MSEQTRTEDHERIWLQGGPDEFGNIADDANRTWCRDNVEPTDTEYVRADLYADLRRQLADREAELLRCRTHENAAAVELDRQLSPEDRERFKELADDLADLRRKLEEAEGERDGFQRNEQILVRQRDAALAAQREAEQRETAAQVERDDWRIRAGEAKRQRDREVETATSAMQRAQQAEGERDALHRMNDNQKTTIDSLLSKAERYDSERQARQQAEAEREQWKAEARRLRDEVGRKPDINTPATIEQIIAHLKEHRFTHQDWASWFEQHPDDPRAKTDIGDAEFHREAVSRYDSMIAGLQQAEADAAAVREGAKVLRAKDRGGQIDWLKRRGWEANDSFGNWWKKGERVVWRQNAILCEIQIGDHPGAPLLRENARLREAAQRVSDQFTLDEDNTIPIRVITPSGSKACWTNVATAVRELREALDTPHPASAAPEGKSDTPNLDAVVDAFQAEAARKRAEEERLHPAPAIGGEGEAVKSDTERLQQERDDAVFALPRAIRTERQQHQRKIASLQRVVEAARALGARVSTGGAGERCLLCGVRVDEHHKPDCRAGQLADRLSALPTSGDDGKGW